SSGGRRSEDDDRTARLAVPGSLGFFHSEPDRALPVGIGHDQAPIDRKSFATDQPGRNTGINNTLEHAAEDVAVTENAHCGRGRMQSVAGSCPRCSSRRTTGTPSRPEPHDRAAAPSGMPKTWPTMSILIISSGSIDGRPTGEQ